MTGCSALFKFTASVLLAGLILATALPLNADEVTLKNGVKLKGRSTPLLGLGLGPRRGKNRGPTTVYNVRMVDTGLARYFVPRLQVADMVPDQLGSVTDGFTLRQPRQSQSVTIQQIGRFTDIQPFDEWGRRQITLTSDGKDRVVVQGITELTPEFLRLKGLNFLWESGMATTSLPPDILDSVLRKATDQENSDHRMAIARFYLEARMYRQAQEELDAIKVKFPEEADNVENISHQLTQLRAQQLFQELELRRAAGQHRLVYESTLKFPAEDVSRSILREVTEMTAAYEAQKKQRDEFAAKLDSLPKSLDDAGQADEVLQIGEAIKQELNVSTLPRLESFFLFTQDAGLPADEQLALAISGWVVGSNHADTQLPRALNLWKARELILEYLGVTPENAHRGPEILKELAGLEGVSAESIARMLPLLPTAVETPGIVPGQPFEVQVTAADEEPAVRYTVVLPPEYHYGHQYPLIVSLREQGKTTQQEVEWWAGTVERPGQAQRHGYIVIAPEYASEDALAHSYGTNSHHVVLESIYDACRRFHVDADRIFLSGHGMGGDAAFDIGLSHPDMFAGVMPICGVIRNNVLFYWDNAEHLPLYVVGGELDRDTPDVNAGVLMRMMHRGYNLIYTEYIGRGREGYYEEIHKLFDWMGRHTRTRGLTDYTMRTVRESDGRFYWFEASGLPESVTVTDWTNRRRRRAPRPMPLKVHISPGNTISITSGAEKNTIWLTPDVVDFESRLKVVLGGRPRYRDFVEPDFKVMLDDFARRGDRQQVFWGRLDF